jgi:hypothetical protein
LNDFASDTAPDFEHFFDKTGVILDPDLFDVIKNQVRQILEHCDGSSGRIPSMLNKCSY